MKEKITNLLKEIENNYNIKILFGIENGSRSWNMASKDSDYDVRFVFYRKMEDYLLLDKKEEVINIAFDENLKVCRTEGSLIDMCGFDIYKYSKLLLSSNPTTLEWLNSKIVYYGNNDISLREYMNNNFSPEKLYMHYYSLFKNNYREFVQLAKMITYKKYLYSMRGLLNAKYVLHFDKIPPLDFTQTVKDLENVLSKDVYNKIFEVIEIKSNGLEKDKIKNIKEFDVYFDDELKKFNVNFKKRRPDIKIFDEFILKTLKF